VEQIYLANTIYIGEYTIELIAHKDLHHYLYINGNLTDMLIPRNIVDNVSYEIDCAQDLGKEEFEILLENIIYGKSEYNEKLLTNIIKEEFPEYFV